MQPCAHVSKSNYCWIDQKYRPGMFFYFHTLTTENTTLSSKSNFISLRIKYQGYRELRIYIYSIDYVAGHWDFLRYSGMKYFNAFWVLSRLFKNDWSRKICRLKSSVAQKHIDLITLETFQISQYLEHLI